MCPLPQATLTEFKAEDENQIVCNRVLSGERTVGYGSQGTRQMSEPRLQRDQSCQHSLNKEEWTPKNEGENDPVTATIMHFSFYSS